MDRRDLPDRELRRRRLQSELCRDLRSLLPARLPRPLHRGRIARGDPGRHCALGGNGPSRIRLCRFPLREAMTAQRRRIDTIAPSKTARYAALADGAMWAVAAVTVFIVPLIVTPSTWDSYRLPKEMLVRSAGILLLGLGAIRAVLFGRSPLWRPDVRWGFVAAVIGWTMVTAL